MAIFGWDTLKMAEECTRAADQWRLADHAMHMIESEEQRALRCQGNRVEVKAARRLEAILPLTDAPGPHRGDLIAALRD
jgi:hypothetical protein